MQASIIKKDLKNITSNKNIMLTLFILPLVLTIFLPGIFVIGIHLAPTDTNDFQEILNLLPSSQQYDNLTLTMTDIVLNNIMPIFFIIIPIMVSSVMAASSFVGEKEKRTLETLLYGPLSLKELFTAKVFASFILSMSISLIAFFAMVTVIEAETILLLNTILMPSLNWLVIIILVSPAVSMLAITLIVSGSAKAQTMEESQQRAVFLILPLILLVLGQFMGVILVNVWLLLVLGLFFAALAYFFMKMTMRKFTYDILLK
jgi:ABC-type Na+ efflux pump permease subunit